MVVEDGIDSGGVEGENSLFYFIFWKKMKSDNVGWNGVELGGK